MQLITGWPQRSRFSKQAVPESVYILAPVTDLMIHQTFRLNTVNPGRYFIQRVPGNLPILGIDRYYTDRIGSFIPDLILIECHHPVGLQIIIHFKAEIGHSGRENSVKIQITGQIIK
ncbi:hypothetical protein SDC9_156193 [bioreactor metagenome]|uniref:Uncharacterized protein n=1 Tax=bioreactor metagenome TaxID=1076179 RepID=A0A645F3I7_9ZZZZ